MRSFLILIGTFLSVYFLAPWLTVTVLHRLPIEHLERYELGVFALTIIAVYTFLRRRFAEHVPRI